MSANPDPNGEYLRLVTEYQTALRLWAQTRSFYPHDASPEVAEAAWRVERLERRIAELRGPATS